MEFRHFCICLFLTVVCGRYLDKNGGADYDPNAARPDYDAGVTDGVTDEIPSEEVTEEAEDLCDDFPPASCIRHFSILPHVLQRSPFGLRTENEFMAVCEAYKKALQCFGDFATRCNSPPEARMFIDQMSQLLSQCDNPQIRQDVIAALDCGKRMASVHERCIRETRFIPQLKSLSSERLIQGETNSIRDLCCGMRYHKACFMDQVQERCGAAAYAANQRLDSVIVRAFTCEQYPESECPATRT